MAGASKHLDDIIQQHNQIANVQAVFLDIESYSRRRTLRQVDVIDRFTECLAASLHAISERYVAYAQTNNINFSTDVIKLPTGDGALVAFTFNGIHDIHIEFAKRIVKEAYELRKNEVCDRFDTDGWCNCHSHFNVRIGISDGKAVIFKDVNGNYNLAGNPVNLSARVMSLMERNQIAFTEQAYQQYVDLADDPNVADHFRAYSNVRIKHGFRIPVYQYMDADAEGLNSEVCAPLVIEAEGDAIYQRLADSGWPLPGQPSEISRAQTVETMKALEGIMKQMLSVAKSQAQMPTVGRTTEPIESERPRTDTHGT